LNLALGAVAAGVPLGDGAKVGANVWFETLNVDLGDGFAVNRLSHVETQLFQDRLMRVGPTTFDDSARSHDVIVAPLRPDGGCDRGARLLRVVVLGLTKFVVLAQAD
jgi:hypothetical protein